MEGIDEDSLTAHAGFGARIALGKNRKIFLRPGGRFRWYEQREDDQGDKEFTLGVGFIIGR